jgi:hypothetical protein
MWFSPVPIETRLAFINYIADSYSTLLFKKMDNNTSLFNTLEDFIFGKEAFQKNEILPSDEIYWKKKIILVCAPIRVYT